MSFRFVAAGARGLSVAVGAVREGEMILGLTAGKWSILDVVDLAVKHVGHGASFIGSSWAPSKTQMKRLLGMLSSGAIGDFRISWWTVTQ